MSLESSIEKSIEQLHKRYSLTEASVDAALQKLEESRFSAVGVSMVLGIRLGPCSASSLARCSDVRRIAS